MHYLAGIAKFAFLLYMYKVNIATFFHADALDPTAVPQVVAAAAAMLPADNTTDLARQVRPAAW